MGQRIDYGSILGPMEQTSSLIAQHLLQAPALKYRMQQEAARQAQEAQFQQARMQSMAVEDAMHKATTRKQLAEAGLSEDQLAAVKEFQTIFSDPNSVRKTPNGYEISDNALRASMALAGRLGPNADNTGSAVRQLMTAGNQTPQFAAKLGAEANKGMVVQPGAVVLNQDATVKFRNPSAAETEAGMSTEVSEYPAVEAKRAVPAVPAKKHWFTADEPAIPEQPAVPYQPARKVTRKFRDASVAGTNAPTKLSPLASTGFGQEHGTDPERDEEGRGMGDIPLTGTRAPGMPARYSSAADVKADVRLGKLDRETAINILTNQFPNELK